MSFVAFLHRVVAGESLPEDDAQRAMELILEGQVSTPQIASFLVALKMKGETVEEVVGFARAMRSKSIRVDAGSSSEPLLDTCGTGGDGCDTFNISTACAFVVAGAGVRVAKHGNRSISSRCGSADILEELGVPILTDAHEIAASIRNTGFGFLFAPALHPAMKHAQPARLELKMRTVFNLLGPLTNPARANAQLIGAPSAAAAELMANALARLEQGTAYVVHGSDGLDEVTTGGQTIYFKVSAGRVERGAFHPEQFGLNLSSLNDLRGGDRYANADIVRRVLNGERGPARDIVLLNAAVAFLAARTADNPSSSMRLAADSIDSGAAFSKLNQLLTNIHVVK